MVRAPAEFQYTRLSIGVQQFEMALEWNYGVVVKPGLLLQPDAQYLVHPSGTRTIRMLRD